MLLNKSTFMKGLKAILVFLIGTCFSVKSQPVTFLKTYLNGDHGYAVRELPGPSYVVAGGTGFYYNYHWMIMSPVASTGIHLYKTSEDGTLIWEKILGIPGYRCTATWMERTNDGGFILTGHANNESVWPPDSNDIVLVKCDSAGDVQWAKKLDSGKDELGFCVKPTFDGGYAISGFHDANPVSLAGYAALIKTDSAGNIEWDSLYQYAVRDLESSEALSWLLCQTADSGYALTGTTAGIHPADIYVIRTSPQGNVIWARSYEHDLSVNRFSLGLDVIEDHNGDLVIAASMDKDHGANEYNYPYIQKISSNGNFIRGYIYNSVPAQPFQSGFSSVIQTPDNGYLFTGMGGYSSFGTQAQILKTDTDFNMEWSRSYTWDGLATMGSRSGRNTIDGGFVFTGKRQNEGSLIFKTDQSGLVPCKSPQSLVEIIPSMLVTDRYPASISGISSFNLTINLVPAGMDTSALCPLSISHLPVELLYFTSALTNKHTVRCEWETASEINNDHFVVERSIDGEIYTSVGTVSGKGNSSRANEYSFEDRSLPEEEVLYYRLRQVDYDGTESISEAVLVPVKQRILKLIEKHIDHDGQKLHLLLSSIGINPVILTMSDASGRIRKDLMIQAEHGKTLISTDISNFSPGIYFYSISDGITRINGKIVY